MRSFAIVALALAACGGKSSTGPGPGPGPAPSGDRLPWEASLTTGATFTLAVKLEADGGEEGEYKDLIIKVTNVEGKGNERVYSLDWGDHGGPSKIVVRGKTVLVGDAEPAAMQEPWEVPGGIMCYAEDFSNPDGCEDVCDASLCLAEGRGIVSASGQYTPGYMVYAAK
jgi:hypothetical protein